ncbi:MAG: 2-C-methyl-D-erythritol 2,4-cyclodiphosphate synthase [Bryobacteraceae bacterium]
MQPPICWSGIGWDIHPLVPGRPLILAGVRIPSELGLAGHSDADVLAHAVTDALLGAAALGDIGQHFPDSDRRWQGADSLAILRQALEMVGAHGLRVLHVDATVILEQPKLGPYREAIREKLAATLSLPLQGVSVKFKTAEKMGPVGEGRAAEALAIVTVAPGP